MARGTVPASLDLSRLRDRFRQGELTAAALVEDILGRVEAAGDDKVWITRVSADALRTRAAALDEGAARASLPLFGIPFAVKDNIDVSGLPTTAACPDFAYGPEVSAEVVVRLEAAGAILIGKTNLDQFATGLVGCRSPYGIARNPFDARFIPGGSSSGSAVAVAAGLVSFALGTDTAGSGRVPAAFNNIVGLKPTRGRISTRGVVPACRSLDCVSIFALSANDAKDVLAVCSGFDAGDPFSRIAPHDQDTPGAAFRFAIPRTADLEFFGDAESAKLFAEAAAALETIGGRAIEIDFAPFRDAAAMLYQGPWVAERLAAIETLMRERPEALLPVTRQIIAGGADYRAVDAFKASYRLAALRRAAETVWRDADVLAVPTAATIYTRAAVEADPLSLNTQLGYYTNFTNLFDLAAIAIPTGFRQDGLPFGITLIGPAFSEKALATLGAALHRQRDLPLGATPHRLAAAEPTAASLQAADEWIEIAVVGGHLSGMPLNGELTDRGARLVRSDRTAPLYRMFLLEGNSPRPGLLRCEEKGNGVDAEIWSLSAAAFGSFVAAVPAPLSIGTLIMEDGRQVKGFLCEAAATRHARDISAYGGWRAFLARERR